MPSFVATTANAVGGSASSSHQVTRSGTIPAGALVVLPVKWENVQTFHSTTPVTDTAGGVWAVAVQRAHAGTPSMPIGGIAYCLSHPGGTGVAFTANFSGTADPLLEMNAMVFTPDAGKAFVFTDAESDEGFGLAFSTPAMSVNGPGVAVQFVAGFQLASGVTAGGTPTFTRDTDTENAGGTSFAQYLIYGSGVTSVTPGASWGALGNEWVMVAAAFNEVSTGPQPGAGALALAGQSPGVSRTVSSLAVAASYSDFPKEPIRSGSQGIV